MQTKRMAKTVMVVFALALLFTSGSTVAGPPTEEGGLGALAPVGRAFTYQGRLNDGGSPANGSYDFEFELYDDPGAGNQKGSTITRDAVAVSEGLFTVELDFGSNRFTGDARWLEIGVRPGGGMSGYTPLTPRQALTATPYALYALNAPWSGLGDVPAGFDDGVDDDTTYAAGTGLTLDGATFSADTAYIQQRVSGSCTGGNAIGIINEDGTVSCESVAAATHDHRGETWSGSGVGLTLNSSDNSGHSGLHIISPGGDGVYMDVPGIDGVYVKDPREDGVQVDSAGRHGIYVLSPEHSGLLVDSPGSDGVTVYSAGRYGVYAATNATYGFYTDNKIFAGNGYVDIAEHIDAASDVEPGDVVVIDPDHDERVVKSTKPYDTSVAGIISTDPALLIGKSDTETPLALAGRAPCKISAENGPIHRGDLLTTSSTPGHAMKATEPQLGTILGKALGELESGTGVIPVLVILQ